MMSSSASVVVKWIAWCVLLGSCMSAHERRIYNAKHDGNAELAECFETCRPDDASCTAGCEQTFPTRWYQRYTAGARPLIEAGKAIEVNVAVALHPLAVADARKHNPPLAACYGQCRAQDGTCLRGCDGQHGTPEDKQRRREMYLAVARIGFDAYMQDRARKTSQTASPTATASSSTSTDPAPSRTPESRGESLGGSSAPSSQPDGACRCKGYPVGHAQASEQRAEQCTPMASSDASACDTSCKAKGYAIGLFRGMSSC